MLDAKLGSRRTTSVRAFALAALIGCSPGAEGDPDDASGSVGDGSGGGGPATDTDDDGHGDGDDSGTGDDATPGGKTGTGDPTATDGGSTGGSDGSSGGTDCQGGKVVHFVYFVEADQPYMESQRDDIETQAYAFQQYWYEQLGVTFYLSEPVVDVIEADHDGQWYVDTPDGIHGDSRWYRLGNVKNEVHAELGIRDFDPDHRVVSYPTSRHDGRVGANFGGAWMDGDDLTCMSGQAGGVNWPYEGGTSAHCLGHVAHEFGHVLGLQHEGPDTDCMQFGFYNDSGGSGMCSFSMDNVAKILAEPDNDGWFEALPGDTCRGA